MPRGRQPGRAAFEIPQTEDTLGALAHPSRRFCPMGDGGAIGPHLLSADALALLQCGRHSCMLCNAIPRDWAEPDGWVETALAQIDRQDWTLMVLYDLPTSAMRHLDRFLDQVARHGITLQQDLPPDCVPLLHGIETTSIDGLVTWEGAYSREAWLPAAPGAQPARGSAPPDARVSRPSVAPSDRLRGHTPPSAGRATP